MASYAGPYAVTAGTTAINLNCAGTNGDLVGISGSPTWIVTNETTAGHWNGTTYGTDGTPNSWDVSGYVETAETTGGSGIMDPANVGHLSVTVPLSAPTGVGIMVSIMNATIGKYDWIEIFVTPAGGGGGGGGGAPWAGPTGARGPKRPSARWY